MIKLRVSDTCRISCYTFVIMSKFSVLSVMWKTFKWFWPERLLSQSKFLCQHWRMTSQSLQKAVPKADLVAEWEEQKSWQPGTEGSVAATNVCPWQRRAVALPAHVGVSTTHTPVPGRADAEAEGSAQSDASCSGLSIRCNTPDPHHPR